MRFQWKYPDGPLLPQEITSLSWCWQVSTNLTGVNLKPEGLPALSELIAEAISEAVRREAPSIHPTRTLEQVAEVIAETAVVGLDGGLGVIRASGWPDVQGVCRIWAYLDLGPEYAAGEDLDSHPALFAKIELPSRIITITQPVVIPADS